MPYQPFDICVSKKPASVLEQFANFTLGAHTGDGKISSSIVYDRAHSTKYQMICVQVLGYSTARASSNNFETDTSRTKLKVGSVFDTAIQPPQKAFG